MSPCIAIAYWYCDFEFSNLWTCEGARNGVLASACSNGFYSWLWLLEELLDPELRARAGVWSWEQQRDRRWWWAEVSGARFRQLQERWPARRGSPENVPCSSQRKTGTVNLVDMVLTCYCDVITVSKNCGKIWLMRQQLLVTTIIEIMQRQL